MGNQELLAELKALAELLAESKRLHEGGFFEAHEVAGVARNRLACIIQKVAAVDA